jgi:hypothetical protein
MGNRKSRVSNAPQRAGTTNDATVVSHEELRRRTTDRDSKGRFIKSGPAAGTKHAPPQPPKLPEPKRTAPGTKQAVSPADPNYLIRASRLAYLEAAHLLLHRINDTHAAVISDVLRADPMLDLHFADACANLTANSRNQT